MISPAVAKHLLAVRNASHSFEDFISLIHPDWHTPPFQQLLISKLNDLEQGTLLNAEGQAIYNLLITMPPRHGKSELATILFPTYFMARDPRRYIMSASYNTILATDFGRQTRNLIDHEYMAQAFPDLSIATDSRAADVWATTANGRYFGVGLHGTTSGRPANLLIVDDPLKSREDAESKANREKVWNYYVSALTTRLQPQPNGHPPCQIIILTRWHPDDLAGRIMQSEDWKDGLWEHIDFPARIEHEDGSKEALWPERFNLDWLARREALNPREFQSLYQQQPFISGGGLIKTEWFQYYSPAEHGPDSPYLSIIIAVDTAFSTKTTADFSVAVVAGITNSGDIHILDIMRKRLDFPDLKAQMVLLNNRYRGRGLRAFYIEDKASGQSLIQELRRSSGMAVIPHKVVNDKVTRTSSVLPLIEGGRVFLPHGAPWLDEFLSECEQFPNSKHDDQVDALTIALDVLSRSAINVEEIFSSLSMQSSLNAHNPYKDKSLTKMADVPSWRGWGV